MEHYYLNLNKKAEEREKAFRNNVLKAVVSLLKTYGKPLVIGNTAYSVCKFKGRNVPAYLLNEGSDGFKPIYDEDKTFEFGWASFEECCRIFDVIRNRLIELKKA